MTIKEIIKIGNYHLIDVREEMELDMDGTLDNALNIPLGELEERKQEILDRAGPKIFFCRSGNRSKKAVEYFKEEGLESVYDGGSFEIVKNLTM